MGQKLSNLKFSAQLAPNLVCQSNVGSQQIKYKIFEISRKGAPTKSPRGAFHGPKGGQNLSNSQKKKIIFFLLARLASNLVCKSNFGFQETNARFLFEISRLGVPIDVPWGGIL